MSEEDIPWRQRFNSYQRALAQLGEFLTKEHFNKLEKQGLIQAFEYTHEAAWKTLADFLKERGVRDIYGSRDATREAFNLGLLSEGELWMSMIKSRNLTSHAYNEETAEAIVKDIQSLYFEAFKQMETKLSEFI